MEHALYFAVTTDGWTSRANHSYLSLTVHYIDDEWTLQSHLLETHQFAQAHTGDNLASELEGMLETWKLPAIKLSATTTDNAANIVLAMEILGWEHFCCFSHSLQLAINQAFDIPQVSRALARARNLVTHFHHSAKSTHLLKEKQRGLKHPSHSLVQQVTTRWNSAYYMLQRVLEQQQPLCATLLELRRTDLMPVDAEIAAMEIFMEWNRLLGLQRLLARKRGSPSQLHVHCYSNFSATTYLNLHLTKEASQKCSPGKAKRLLREYCTS